MKLSIVTTLYRSEEHIYEFHKKISSSAKKLIGEDYELIYVNDGSPDKSLDIVLKIADEDSHVIVVDLSRNFGHYKAMMTGLSYTQGDRVFLIDCDLEEDPEYLISFTKQMEEENCDVVYGVQEKRRGHRIEKFFGHCFYNLVNTLSGMYMPVNVLVARLMTRRYLDALLLHKERELYIAGIWHITGFDQRPQNVIKYSTSETTYTLRKKISIVVDSVTSFSSLPLVAIFYIGVIISTIALSYTAYILLFWAFFSKPLSGWTSLILSIWLLGGMIISFIGIVGIYLSKIYSEVKQRPYTIVKQVYSKNINT